MRLRNKCGYSLFGNSEHLCLQALVNQGRGDSLTCTNRPFETIRTNMSARQHCCPPGHSAVSCASSRHPGLRAGRVEKGSYEVPDHACGGQLSSRRGRTHAVSYARGQASRTNLVKQPRFLEQCLARSARGQPARATSGWHVGHDVARFTSIRDWRATFLAAASSSGMWAPVPKYISSGV